LLPVVAGWFSAAPGGSERRERAVRCVLESAWVIGGWGAQDEGAVGLVADPGPEPAADPV
jgi:hypothetical protein